MDFKKIIKDNSLEFWWNYVEKNDINFNNIDSSFQHHIIEVFMKDFDFEKLKKTVIKSNEIYNFLISNLTESTDKLLTDDIKSVAPTLTGFDIADYHIRTCIISNIKAGKL